MNDSNQKPLNIQYVEIGLISPQEIEAYVDGNHNLTLRNPMEISELQKVDIESTIRCRVSDLHFYLIKEFGFSAGALLMREFDWELAAILSGKTSVNYMEETIKLDKNEAFLQFLTKLERQSLRFISNAYRVAISQQTYSKNLEKNSFFRLR